MVSAIWNACSLGDFALVQDLLKDASLADIEIKGRLYLADGASICAFGGVDIPNTRRLFPHRSKWRDTPHRSYQKRSSRGCEDPFR